MLCAALLRRPRPTPYTTPGKGWFFCCDVHFNILIPDGVVRRIDQTSHRRGLDLYVSSSLGCSHSWYPGSSYTTASKRATRAFQMRDSLGSAGSGSDHQARSRMARIIVMYVLGVLGREPETRRTDSSFALLTTTEKPAGEP